MVTTTLMRAVDRIGDWSSFINEGAEDYGHHEFEYAIIMMGAKDTLETVSHQGRNFASETCAVQHVDQGLLPQVMLTCVRSSHLSKLAAKHPPFASGELTMGDDETSSGLFGTGKSPLVSRDALPKVVLMSGAWVAPGSLVLSTVKRAHYDPNAYVVRVYNPTNATISGNVFFPVDLSGVFRSRLDESKLDQHQLESNSRSVALSVGSREIVSLLAYPK